jgi:hypothetical protein
VGVIELAVADEILRHRDTGMMGLSAKKYASKTKGNAYLSVVDRHLATKMFTMFFRQDTAAGQGGQITFGEDFEPSFAFWRR